MGGPVCGWSAPSRALRLDSAVELGGFAFGIDDRALAECVDERLLWLTDNRRIGVVEWLEDPGVFLERARAWPPGG